MRFSAKTGLGRDPVTTPLFCKKKNYAEHKMNIAPISYPFHFLFYNKYQRQCLQILSEII